MSDEEQRMHRQAGTHVLEEDLEDTTGLLVDEAGDTLHTSTTGEAADGGLGDTCTQCQQL